MPVIVVDQRNILIFRIEHWSTTTIQVSRFRYGHHCIELRPRLVMLMLFVILMSKWWQTPSACYLCWDFIYNTKNIYNTWKCPNMTCQNDVPTTTSIFCDIRPSLRSHLVDLEWPFSHPWSVNDQNLTSNVCLLSGK